MAATTDKGTRWGNLKTALTDLQDLLRCWTCNKVFMEPVSYRCGHFFCGNCAKEAGTKCSSCKVPSLASEIRPDRIVTAVVGCFGTLSNIVNCEKEELLATGLGNISNKSSTSTVYDNEAQNIYNKISIKPKPVTERKSAKNLEGSDDSPKNNTVKEAFVKPSRVRKGTAYKNLKVASSARIKAGNSFGSERSNENSFDSFQETILESTKTSKENSDSNTKSFNSDSLKSRTKKMSCGSDEEFPHDIFATPNKPRRNSNSKAKEKNYPIVKSTPRRSNIPGRELVKRNYKGETPLHVACIKGNIPRVCSLLEANASPNTKDNAGWTPLHEAVNHGFTEVVELLVKAGAFLDVPGAGNVTPLHEAVINNHVAIVKLLVAHGADVYARSSDGKTPLDLAASDELKDALLNSKKECESKADVGALKPSVEEMVLCGESGLTYEEKKQLCTVAVTLDVRIVPAFGPDVTHLIVPSDDKGSCPPSMEVLCAILKGVFILNRDWLEMQKEGNWNFADETFEIAGVMDFVDTDAPKLSRINAQKQLPGLFNGCHFFVTNNACYKLLGCNLSRLNILTLIKTGGGVVLTRQPDPEAIPASEKTVPYHAPRNGDLTSTSHFIIYSPGKGEPEMKYNMKHCKTLTVQWFINCVLNWRLVDP